MTNTNACIDGLAENVETMLVILRASIMKKKGQAIYWTKNELEEVTIHVKAALEILNGDSGLSTSAKT